MGDRTVQVQLAGLDQVDGLAELPVLQAGTSHIQFFGGDQELVHDGVCHGEAHGDDTARVSCNLQGIEQGIFHAGCVDGHGGAVAVGDLPDSLLQVFLHAVDGPLRAVGVCLFQLLIDHIGHDDVRAVQSCDLQDAGAQGAGTDDEKGVLFTELCSGAALDRDGGGLDHDGISVRDPVRKEIALVIRHCDPLAVAAVDMHAADLQVSADVRTAVAACPALSAGSDLVHDDAVANLDAGHALSDLLDHANALVADNAGISRRSVGSVIDSDIGSADACGGHPDNYVVLCVQDRLRLVHHAEVIRFHNSDCFHFSFTSSRKYSGYCFRSFLSFSTHLPRWTSTSFSAVRDSCCRISSTMAWWSLMESP